MTAAAIGMLGEQAFRDYLLNHYVPGARERIPATDPTYRPGTTYPQICQTRCWLLYQALVEHTGVAGADEVSEVLDVGPFPGTQARVLAHLLGGRLRLSAAGLGMDDAFIDEMASTFDCYHHVDLDPFYAGLGRAIRISVPDRHFDAVYALEIVEHLISPLPFLSETARLLKPGGICLISTPNVANAGAIVRLLRGHSNYESLDASPMYQTDNSWRGHVRLYAKDELIDLAARHGLRCIEHRYYQEAGARHLSITAATPFKTGLRRWLSTLVPRLGDDQFLVLRKMPTDGVRGDAPAARA